MFHVPGRPRSHFSTEKRTDFTSETGLSSSVALKTLTLSIEKSDLKSQSLEFFICKRKIIILDS